MLFQSKYPPKWMPKSSSSASSPLQQVNFSNFSFQKHKKIKNVHATWTKYPQVAKKTSKTPPKSLPKPVQNPSKIPSKIQLKKTQFLTPFFPSFGTLGTWKMLLPSRRNAIFYKIDVFEQSTKMTSQNTPKTPSKSTKNQEKNDHENKSRLERPILFRSFPIFLNFFEHFPISGQKNQFGSPILCHPPQTPPSGLAPSQRDSAYALPVTWTAGEREARRKNFTNLFA